MSAKGLQILAKGARPPSSELSVWSWAVVTAASPLRVKLDNEDTALDVTPDTLIDGLAIADRVWVQLVTNTDPARKARRVMVHGRAGGLPEATLTSFTPVLLGASSNPTQGTGGSQSGTYVMDPVTRMVDCSMHWRFGTAGNANGTGIAQFELPHIVDSAYHGQVGTNGLGDLLGTGFLRDNSPGPTVYGLRAWYQSATGGPNGRTLVQMYYTTETPIHSGLLTFLAPVTMAASDGIRLNLRYRAA